jgi:glycosyltransferase involved in cell wall biosynthesis
MSPLVSIIVPVYNTAEYVEECIQSILSQSYKNIELILVNDGSTDGSGEICKKYEKLPNVQYLEQDNLGVVEARKRGVEKARGEWIMFVDSDDLLLEDGIQQLMLLSPGADIVIGRHQTNSSLLNAPCYYEWDDYLYKLFIHSIPWGPWAKLFKRELISNCSLAFEYNIRRGEDVLMNLAIANNNRKKVPICHKAVYDYKKRENSTINTYKYTYDYCKNVCSIAESLVCESIPADKLLSGDIINRLYYYKKVLVENNFQSDRHHPFVKGIIRRMNEAKVLRLSDRMILYVSNRNAVKLCMFLSKFIRRIENPSLLIDDINRLRKKF